MAARLLQGGAEMRDAEERALEAQRKVWAIEHQYDDEFGPNRAIVCKCCKKRKVPEQEVCWEVERSTLQSVQK